MATGKVYRAIGLMSGTSMDGVDIALIETDGKDYVVPKAFAGISYTVQDRALIQAVKGRRTRDQEVNAAERMITDRHIRTVQDFIKSRRLEGTIDVIGFHGQTICHDPANKFTWQIGDAQALADAVGIDVVADMRQADVKAGGQGAPLLPLYHRALINSSGIELPVAIQNIGGVGNVTWIGKNEILAFDTGPGNALIDDFVKTRTGESCDKDGALARSGNPEPSITNYKNFASFFADSKPKSLDRDAWAYLLKSVEKLSDADGARTLTEVTVLCIAVAESIFPEAVKAWYVAGGGRHNKFMMERLAQELKAPVHNIDILGWNGDATEAEGFAYLAVRSLLGLSLSEPGTTGVPRSMTGGVAYQPRGIILKSSEL